MSKDTKARVSSAFRAMKARGISEDKVRPVLKNLMKMNGKNWALIEEENYSALANAIFDSDKQAEERSMKVVKIEDAEVQLKNVDTESLKMLGVRYRDEQTKREPGLLQKSQTPLETKSGKKATEEVNPKKRKAAQVVEEAGTKPPGWGVPDFDSWIFPPRPDADSPPYLASGSLQALEQACPEGMHKWLSETSPTNVFNFSCQSVARGFLGMLAAQRCYDHVHQDRLDTKSEFEAFRRDHESCQSLESDRVTLVAKLKESEEKLKQVGEAHMAELEKVKAGYESELSQMKGAFEAKLSEAKANYDSELSKVKDLQSDLARTKKIHDLHLDSCLSSKSKLEEELTSLKASLPDVRAKAIEEYKIAEAYMLKMIRENKLPDDIVDMRWSNIVDMRWSVEKLEGDNPSGVPDLTDTEGPTEAVTL